MVGGTRTDRPAEPIGTHRDHQGLGHGRRLVLGLCTALASAGASAAAVETPVANVSAVRAYTRAGFRTVTLLTPMHPPSTPTEVAAPREQDLDLGEYVVGAAPGEGDAGATVAVAVHDAAR